jgi:hypothetical protein
MIIMEFASKIRWAIFITVGVIVLILISWGLFSIAKSLFSPDLGTETVKTEDTNKGILNDANTFSFTTIGPIVADEEHKETIITVSANVVEMKVFSGYNNKVVESRSYKNTPAAFSEFRSALQILDVSSRIKGTNTDDDNTDEGFCPTGKRYILEINSEIRRWNTTCSSKQGTAGFSMNSVRRMFQNQVSDYADINQGTGL